MLPKMSNVHPCRTKLTRKTKLFEELRIGALRLFFSHFELIAFELDGKPPVVCMPPEPRGVETAGHIEDDRKHLESDKAKWIAKAEFERQWEAVAATLFRF